MAAGVRATGVLIRLATEDEMRALVEGRDLSAFAGGSYFAPLPDGEPGPSEAGIVVRAFVELDVDGRPERWDGAAHYGFRVPTDRDPTLRLLDAAREPELVDLLADLRIAGLDVSRWDLLSAPHRIELDPELERRLPPRRRG